ncbi:MAG: cyclic nucleotide-binding domain-containing protein [bacterium]
MLSNIEKALFLKTVNLFESMTPDQLKILTNISEEVDYQAGDILFNENDPSDYLYVIVDGEIEIVKNHGSAGELRLAVLHPKASFGELTLFGNEGRSATAIANKDSTFLAIEKEHLLLLIKENPAISTTILFQLANMIRELNKNVPFKPKEEPEAELAPADGAGRSGEMRLHPRVAIPGVVEAPDLSDTPLVLDNISAGGLLITVPKKPDPENEYPISLKFGGLTFQWDKATVIWSKLSDSINNTWKVALKLEMTEEERKKLTETLKKKDD